MTRRIRTAVGAAVLLLSLVLPLAAAAIETETFGFEPWPSSVAGAPRGRFDVRIPPGGATTEQARLYNRTDQARTYRLYGADVSTDPATGEASTSSADATPTGVGSWIELDPADRTVELGPGEQRIVEFRIVRPADAAVGGLGALVAEELAPAQPGGGISVRFRIALRIDATHEADEGAVSVATLDLDVPFQLVPSRGVLSAIVSNGEADTVTPRVQLHVDRGGRRYVVLQEQVTLRPGDEARFEVEWLSVPASGGYVTPGVELSWEGGDLRVAGERRLVLPGWLPVLLLFSAAWLLYRHGREPAMTPGDVSSPIGASG